jgi:hypothetical protein
MAVSYPALLGARTIEAPARARASPRGGGAYPPLDGEGRRAKRAGVGCGRGWGASLNRFLGGR